MTTAAIAMMPQLLHNDDDNKFVDILLLWPRIKIMMMMLVHFSATDSDDDNIVDCKCVPYCY